jgi:hypothetical protein
MKFDPLWQVFIAALLCLSALAQESTDSNKSRGGIRPGGKTVEKFVRTRSQPKPAKVPPEKVVSRLGIGLTIHRQGAADQWITADPRQPFRAGDRIRFQVETNTPGYLYLFNTTNQGGAVMIFPAGDLNDGRNAVKAHVPYLIPAEQPYFEFQGQAGTERMLILLTRQPLSGVLRERFLVDYCNQKRQQNPQEHCVWGPSAVEWEGIMAKTQAEWIGVQENTIGQSQPQAVQNAASRGIRPPPKTPAPTIVRMRASPKSTKIALGIDLRHTQE